MNDEILIKQAMARGFLVLDENLENLEQELIKRNIKIVKVKKGLKDPFIKENILPGRIFVTNNSKDFIDDASSYQYGIIATEKIKFKDPKNLAKKISDEIIKNKLWSKPYGFILELSEKESSFRSLTE
jgi:hypothetical protein